MRIAKPGMRLRYYWQHRCFQEMRRYQFQFELLLMSSSFQQLCNHQHLRMKLGQLVRRWGCCKPRSRWGWHWLRRLRQFWQHRRGGRRIQRTRWWWCWWLLSRSDWGRCSTERQWWRRRSRLSRRRRSCWWSMLLRRSIELGFQRRRCNRGGQEFLCSFLWRY